MFAFACIRLSQQGCLLRDNEASSPIWRFQLEATYYHISYLQSMLAVKQNPCVHSVHTGDGYEYSSWSLILTTELRCGKQVLKIKQQNMFFVHFLLNDTCNLIWRPCQQDIICLCLQNGSKSLLKKQNVLGCDNVIPLKRGRNNHENDAVLFPQWELYSNQIYKNINIYRIVENSHPIQVTTIFSVYLR